MQIFDSWASELEPQDFDVFAGPYIQKIIDSVRGTHPDLAIILYISGSGGLLERMAACKPDVVSVDQRVDMTDAIKRIGPSFAVQVAPPPDSCHCHSQKGMRKLACHLYCQGPTGKHLPHAGCLFPVRSASCQRRLLSCHAATLQTPYNRCFSADGSAALSCCRTYDRQGGAAAGCFLVL